MRNMSEHGKRICRVLLRLLPIAGMVALILVAATRVEDWSVEALLHLAPKNLWAAAGFLLLFYAFKSLSFVFPIVVLQMAAGMLFPLGLALAVNLLGMFLSAVLPYLIGRFSGGNLVEALQNKYPKLNRLTGLYQGRELFFSYLLRVVGVPPMDVASLLLGAMRLRFPRYLAGSMLGFLPGLIAVTIIGDNVANPATPAFFIALAAWVAIIIGSLLLYRRAVRAGRE